MRYDDYPALFKDADSASNAFQRSFLTLIKLEYALLITAAILSVPRIDKAVWYAVIALVLVLSAGALLVRSIWKPEQHWYRARALAESVKTLAWRYSMGAHPFDGASATESRQEMRDNLARILQLNAESVGRLASGSAADDQVTAEMDRLRELPLLDRRNYYQEFRVQQQRRWYRDKSAANKRIARRWVFASVIGYILAIALSLARIACPDWTLWPIEPLIVAASSVVGWVQIKKFNELAASYAVTAQEIGMINITLENDVTVKTFSDFVNEAEGAFSREHTLWIARQAH